MTTLPEYLATHGHTLDGLPDASLLDLEPGGIWVPSDAAGDATNVRVWTDPRLLRSGFQPTIVASIARIIPGLAPEIVLDRLDHNAATLPQWHVRAHTRSTDDRGRLTSDTLGSYQLDEMEPTASTVATIWTEDGTTLMKQVVVTTFADQLSAHADALTTSL